MQSDQSVYLKALFANSGQLEIEHIMNLECM